jgi:ABC-type polysaccharide/polyol phosphate export permease
MRYHDPSTSVPVNPLEGATTEAVEREAGQPLEPAASQVGAILADAALAILCYFAAYRLRFDGAELSRFLPAAYRTVGLVAGMQVIAIAAAGTYTYRRGRRWLPRLVAGIALGTTAGTILTYVIHGFEGLSRIAFVVDALLLTLGAFTWRSGIGLLRLARAARFERESGVGLEDRSAPPSVSAGLLGILRYRELLRNLVLKDLKLKYRGSVFGFVWSLANPLMMVAVYTVAFTYILRVRAEGFVFLLLIGLLSWGFFANSAMMATAAIVENGGLMRSVGFPRAILPVATVLFNLAQFVLTITVFLPLSLVIFGIPLSPVMLLFVLFLALQILFTTGVALILAAATAFFRDVRHILEIALSAMFWATPIVYQYQSVPESLRLPVLLSPVSPFVVAYQQILFYGRAPDPPVWLAAFGYAAGTFVLGASVFVSYEDQLAEQV